MNIFIENYRGIDIIFNTENERFSYEIDLGSWNEKQSYAACKKSIDEYKKLNSDFVPFLVRDKESGTLLNIIGIRKDQRFIFTSDRYKQPTQMSQWDEKNYIEYKEDDDKQYATIAVIETQIDDLKKEIKDIKNNVSGASLTELKKKYL